MSGQMSLFDIASDEDKESFRVKIPVNMGEYPRDMLLAFEKGDAGYLRKRASAGGIQRAVG